MYDEGDGLILCHTEAMTVLSSYHTFVGVAKSAKYLFGDMMCFCGVYLCNKTNNIPFESYQALEIAY
jgi:hypothetical protein